MPTQTTLLWLISAIALLAIGAAVSLYGKTRQLRAELHKRRSREADLQRKSAVDVVTGVLNRRGFLEQLGRECARASRNGYPLSVVMLDFDNFKDVNDTHGHATGDRVLQAVARACRSTLREPDFVGRLGGDEFAICMPHTDLKAASPSAQRVCAMVSSTAVAGPGGVPISITVSAGCAALQNHDTPESIMARADAGVYEAKRLGRNQVAAS